MIENSAKFFIAACFLLLSYQIFLGVNNDDSNKSSLELIEHKNPVPPDSIIQLINDALKWANDAERQNHVVFDSGIDFFNKFSPIVEKIFGAEHSHSINSSILLYQMCMKAKKYDEALPAAWKIYRWREKQLGKEHSETLDALFSLGNLYLIKGKYGKAEEFLKRVYRLTKSRVGQNHKNTIEILLNLANVYRQSGDPEKLKLALRYYKKVYDVRANDPEMGAEHELTLEPLRHIGNVFTIQRKFTEAAETFQKILNFKIRTRGEGEDENGPLTQEVKSALFHALAVTGKSGQAKKMLGKEDQEIDKDDDSLYFLVAGKAAALANTRKYAKAVELLTTFYEQEVEKPRVSTNIFEVLDHLITVNQQMNNTEQTLNWAHVLIDLFKNQKVKVKLEVTTAEERERNKILCLNAIAVAIHIYSDKHDEEKIDDLFKLAGSIGVIQGQDHGSGSVQLVKKRLLIAGSVAKFKKENDKSNEALILYERLAQYPHDEEISVSALFSLFRIAFETKDQNMVENIVLKMSENIQESEPGLEIETGKNPEEKLVLRESVAQFIITQAKDQFEQENYESAFSIFKILAGWKSIWPKSWTENDAMSRLVFEGLGISALKLGKLNEGILYL